MNEEGLKILPESIHEWDEVKNTETSEDFWKRIGNMRSKFGTGVFKPGEDAGSEDWGKFTDKVIELSDGRLMPKPDLEDKEQKNALFRLLGKPEDAKGYEFAEIDGAPKMDDARKEFLSNAAFEAGLTKSQLKALDETVRTADINSMEKQKEEYNDALKELRQEWGLATDDRMNSAIKIAKTFFPQLGDKPILSASEYKSFFSIASQLGKGSTEFLEQGDQFDGGITPGEASEKIAEIRGNKNHPYHDMHNPGHKSAKKKMRELYLVKNNLPPE